MGETPPNWKSLILQKILCTSGRQASRYTVSNFFVLLVPKQDGILQAAGKKMKRSKHHLLYFRLENKVEYCKQILALCQLLEPGISTQKGEKVQYTCTCTHIYSIHMVIYKYIYVEAVNAPPSCQKSAQSLWRNLCRVFEKYSQPSLSRSPFFTFVTPLSLYRLHGGQWRAAASTATYGWPSPSLPAPHSEPTQFLAGGSSLLIFLPHGWPVHPAECGGSCRFLIPHAGGPLLRHSMSNEAFAAQR
jgi:hypothetical protein